MKILSITIHHVVNFGSVLQAYATQKLFEAKGADFITPEGEVVSNGRLTVAPPPARSYAYMTDTLYREKFAAYSVIAEIVKK